jgi:hypothetical protein
MGDITLTMNTTKETPMDERPTIGKFLQRNTTYTTVICENQMTPERKQTYILDHNRIERDEHIVWGPDGTSPCIRTANRIFILIKKHIEVITIEGLAALQGIATTMSHHLPDMYKARKAIGNAITGHMHTHIPTEVIQYYNKYLKIAEDHDRKRREEEDEEENYRNLTNSVHARACKTTTRTYEDQRKETELYKRMLKRLTAHNSPEIRGHNGIKKRNRLFWSKWPLDGIRVVLRPAWCRRTDQSKPQAPGASGCRVGRSGAGGVAGGGTPPLQRFLRSCWAGEGLWVCQES